MKLLGKHTGLILLAVIFALVLVVNYQCNNPVVIEVPADPVQIDESLWVQRSEYVKQSDLLKEARKENEELYRRIKTGKDQIASYTTVTGQLNTAIDSLKSELDKWHSVEVNPATNTIPDTVYITEQHYGKDLFKITAKAEFLNNRFKQYLEFTQLRNIDISVINTVSKDQARVITYVSSPDFKTLEYQSYTALKQKKRWPWFFIGVGAGAAGTVYLMR